MINLEEIEKELKPGAFSTFDMEVMLPELQKLKPGDVYLEIGVDRGKSLSFARKMTDPGVLIYGVDIRETNPQVEGTIFLWGDSAGISDRWEDSQPISLLFIDGDHSYDGCKRDIVSWFLKLKEDAVIIFHDCDETSPGVLQAVAEFVNTHTVQSFELFNRTDKNTSMAKIQL